MAPPASATRSSGALARTRPRTRAQPRPLEMFGLLRCFLLSLLLCLLLPATACNPVPAARDPARLEVVDVLGGRDTAGFERALQPRDFDFPLDHGAHPSFASEWWYFTGNLASEEGRRFGYQLTFFRISLTPPGQIVPRPSAWAGNQVWMAHFALTDIEGERFFAFDRFQRGALGLAGAQASPWRVWLDDWSLEQVGETPFPLRLRARQRTGAGRAGGAGGAGSDSGDPGEHVAIDLTLDALKPVVLQGDHGLSRKGPTPGNASYYYSYTVRQRLARPQRQRTEQKHVALLGRRQQCNENVVDPLHSGPRPGKPERQPPDQPDQNETAPPGFYRWGAHGSPTPRRARR